MICVSFVLSGLALVGPFHVVPVLPKRAATPYCRPYCRPYCPPVVYYLRSGSHVRSSVPRAVVYRPVIHTAYCWPQVVCTPRIVYHRHCR